MKGHILFTSLVTCGSEWVKEMNNVEFNNRQVVFKSYHHRRQIMV